MNAKELIKELQKIPPNTRIVLWKWNRQDSKSEFFSLVPTINPHQKGMFMLAAGELEKREVKP